MKRIFVFSLLSLLIIFSHSCQKKGCTNSGAVNYDKNAKKDDGTCKYSSATFYSTESVFPDTIKSIEVSLDGGVIGSISKFYNVAPDCNASGTVYTTLTDAIEHTWDAKILFKDGIFITISGKVKSNGSAECQKVDVLSP